mmetsp:Transcript_4172/g.17160  ORF Transcript_4172/g.17160 Transcript_4172/m.17160 type:complete len:221 (-) Transcript_4172:621-1283(-)
MAPRQEHRVRAGSRGHRRETVQGGERRVRLPVQQRRPGTRLGILVERRGRVIVAGIGEVETTAVVLVRGGRRARERRGRSVHRRRSLRVQDRKGHRRRPHETHRSKPARAVRLARPPRGTRVRRPTGPVADGGGQGATKAGTDGARERRDASVHGTSQRVARPGIAPLRRQRRWIVLGSPRRGTRDTDTHDGGGVVGSRGGGRGVGRGRDVRAVRGGGDD